MAAGTGKSTSLMAPVGVNSWVKLVGKVAVVRTSSGGVVSVSSESTVSSPVIVGVVGTSEAANASEPSAGGVGVVGIS